MKTKLKMTILLMLILFATIPLFTNGVFNTIFLVESGKQQIEMTTHNYMTALAETAVENLEYYRVDEGQEDYLCMANLEEEAKDRKVKGLDSSYYYIVDGHTGTMLYHPTADKIGKSVENDAVKQLMTSIKSNIIPEPGVITYTYKGEKKYAGYAIGNNGEYIVVVTADKSEVMAGINKMQLYAIILEMILLAFFITLASWIAKKVYKPLVQVTFAIENTANGNLDSDLTVIKTHISETKRLIAATKQLKEQLNEIISKTKYISTDLVTDANNVNKLAEISRDAASQISSVSEDIAQGSTTMANNVQTINEQVMNIGINVDEISTNTNVLVDLSNTIKTANNDAAEYISKVSETSNQSAEAVTNIQSQINETNKAIAEIQEAVELIQSVAGQTRLLALNASIEAARAGDAGKGFSVVAQEIGNLSTQSNESANKINAIVQNIITQSEKLVTLSNDVSGFISEEQSCITDTQQKFDILNNNIEQSINEIGSISSKVDLLLDSKNIIIESVTDLSALSEENAASTEEVSASITTISDDINKIDESSKKTTELVDILSNTIAYFK